MCLWLNNTQARSQLASFEELLRCDHQREKHCLFENNNSGLVRGQRSCCYSISYIRTREYSSLKEEQRTTLRAFLGGKDVLAILSTDISKSLIQLLVPMMIALSNCWFSKPVMDRWVVQSPVKYLFKVPACFQTVSSSAVIRWFCITNRPLNLVPNQPSKPSLNLQTVL